MYNIYIYIPSPPPSATVRGNAANTNQISAGSFCGTVAAAQKAPTRRRQRSVFCHELHDELVLLKCHKLQDF